MRLTRIPECCPLRVQLSMARRGDRIRTNRGVECPGAPLGRLLLYRGLKIASFLLDPGLIDWATAHRLESRIIAHGESRASEGHRDGIAAAARKAAAVAASFKGANQRAAAQKVWHAVDALLPYGREAEKEAYARGFKDGAEHRSKWQRTAGRSEPHRR